MTAVNGAVLETNGNIINMSINAALDKRIVFYVEKTLVNLSIIGVDGEVTEVIFYDGKLDYSPSWKCLWFYDDKNGGENRRYHLYSTKDGIVTYIGQYIDILDVMSAAKNL